MVKESAACGEGKAFYTSIITSMDPQQETPSYMKLIMVWKYFTAKEKKKKTQEVEEVIY